MNAGPHMKSDREWTFKKEISLPGVAALLFQTGTIIWFVATLNIRVDNIAAQAASYAPQTEKIIRLETKIESIQDGIAEIKGILRSTAPTGKRSEGALR